MCVCFSVFQERPEIPPSQAQAQARSIPPDQYSYTASILRLLCNKPFMLLMVSYGGSLLVAFICTTNRLMDQDALCNDHHLDYIENLIKFKKAS